MIEVPIWWYIATLTGSTIALYQLVRIVTDHLGRWRDRTLRKLKS